MVVDVFLNITQLWKVAIVISPIYRCTSVATIHDREMRIWGMSIITQPELQLEHKSKIKSCALS
jgi:hypothetical protein